MTRAELEAAEHGSVVTVTARVVRGMGATHGRTSDYVTVIMGPEGDDRCKVNVYADHIVSVSPTCMGPCQILQAWPRRRTP